jgi:hypothetical protein
LSMESGTNHNDCKTRKEPEWRNIISSS